MGVVVCRIPLPLPVCVCVCVCWGGGEGATDIQRLEYILGLRNCQYSRRLFRRLVIDVNSFSDTHTHTESTIHASAHHHVCSHSP